MTDFLVAAASVHVTAAAADYLTQRLADDDTVTVVAVEEPNAPARDAGDALNVARSRFVTVSTTTKTREGDPTEELLAAVGEHDPDEVLVGTHRGTPDSAGDTVGSTATALLGRLDRPVVVLPLP